MTKTEAKKYLTVGNHKLSKHVATFDLPASMEVCGRICPGCYAEKAQRIYPAVLPARERKLAFSKTDEFVGTLLEAIQALKVKYIRVHSSGEMYSQDYLDKWVEIATSLPQQKFYTYTKRLDDFDFSKLKALPNFVVINSLHSDKLNYGPIAERPPGMFLCPDYNTKDVICGASCSVCMEKEAEKTGVYFVKH